MRAAGPRARTTVVLGIAFILERLDEVIMSAVYTPLGLALHATPSQLGTLTLCRALVQARPKSPAADGTRALITDTHVLYLNPTGVLHSL